jgi:hypothetical protein
MHIKVEKVKHIEVEKSAFDALIARLIATPASAKDGIKKPIGAPRRPKSRPLPSTPRT